jgi:hypothetical protein
MIIKRMLFRISLLALTALLLCNATQVGAQAPEVNASLKPFELGEELVYEGEISKLMFRKLDIADFRFTSVRAMTSSSSPANASARIELFLTGEVSTKGFFAKLFNIKFHEKVESTVEPTSFTVRTTKKLDEQGKRVRTSEAIFDPATCKVVWTERDPNDPARPARTESSPFQNQVQDILSAIYFMRSQPLVVGKDFEFSISDSGRVYKIPVKVGEKRQMKNVVGRVAVIRVDPELFGPDRMINVNGQLSIWLTDDDRRIPVKAQIKNQFGTFYITLKKVINAGRAPVAQP